MTELARKIIDAFTDPKLREQLLAKDYSQLELRILERMKRKET